VLAETSRDETHRLAYAPADLAQPHVDRGRLGCVL